MKDESVKNFQLTVAILSAILETVSGRIPNSKLVQYIIDTDVCIKS